VAICVLESRVRRLLDLAVRDGFLIGLVAANQTLLRIGPAGWDALLHATDSLPLLAR
jgi:hypothetical protein